MTLKPNYVRGFLKTLGYFFVLIMVFEGGIPFLQHHQVDWSGIVSMAVFGGVFLGVGACVMFTPRELSWDEEKISLRVNFPKSGEYSWRQLEAYSTWSGRILDVFAQARGDAVIPDCPCLFQQCGLEGFSDFPAYTIPGKEDLGLDWT